MRVIRSLVFWARFSAISRKRFHFGIEDVCPPKQLIIPSYCLGDTTHLSNVSHPYLNPPPLLPPPPPTCATFTRALVGLPHSTIAPWRLRRAFKHSKFFALINMHIVSCR